MIKQQLIQWIGIELWHLPEWYTRSEIAKCVGCTKSPTLLKALRELVEQGVLIQSRGLDAKNRPVIKYKILVDYREEQIEGAKNAARE